MLIYILHQNRMFAFRLPEEVSGYYVLTDYDADNKIRNLINVIEINGKWSITSNNDVTVSFNGEVKNDVVTLELYNFYHLNYFNNEKIILYVCPSNESESSIYKIKEGTTLKIGNDPSSDIILSGNLLGNTNIELTHTSTGWNYVNKDKIPVYINRKSEISGKLNEFDNIFISGYRFVLLKDKIILNFPNSLAKINSNNLELDKPFYNKAEVPSDDNLKDFYSSDDYLLKSPVFSKKIDEYKVTITTPPEKEKNQGGSGLAQIIPSALMTVGSLVSTYFAFQSYISGNSNQENFITNVVMCGIMLVTGIVWPIIEVFAEKVKSIINERIRVLQYKRYLKRKRADLGEVLKNEKLTLDFNSLSVEECQNAIINRNSYLFSKNIDSPNFLSVKFGEGRVPSYIKFDYSKPDLIVENDKLLKEVDKLIDDYKYIDDSPFVFSLLENRSLAIINSSCNYSDYMKSIILQLVALHDYKSLKICVFTNENSCLKQIRNLNHCWNNDRSVRFFATNNVEAENLSSELIRIFNKNSCTEDGKELDSFTNYDTHYLVITDSLEEYKNLKIFEKIIRSKINFGFSLLMFSSKVYNVPLGCNAFIEYKDNIGSFFRTEMDENNIVKFNLEVINDKIDFSKCISIVNNVPIKIDNELKGSLPDKLGFLEMYNVGRLEQLNILNRWKNSSIVNSLAAPVGVDSNGNILYLDLHEKKHGPHGLVAGMTGSGKSEFIVTYILSLAINYNPNEVQFVLIDYKGGGLAGAFENRKTGVKLPHLVGTITNLDKSEMNRTLVSIKSELQRRQKKFNEAKELLNTGSIDIYKYQGLVREGALKDPMSHLFIICDEFAELKEQQPEFMTELISAARIGRSLGIHLILATQKPSGVVDDQIWANAKFKVCCKVQTTEDSNEMIRRPDAASLKESGRFYLQVGYDEYFALGQSGYSGVQYIPSDRVVSKLDTNVQFINNSGDIYRNVIKKEESDTSKTDVKYGEELNNILKYIVDVADSQGYKYSQLWLENVPQLLMYNDLRKKYSDIKTKAFDINPIIGEYDDPKNQAQGCVTLPITMEGNTLLFGATGKGKTTFLSTVIYSTILSHTSTEVNFYIVDLGSEKLRKFSRAPQVGEVLGINDRQKITYLFYMIEAEIVKRQRYYSSNGGDFFTDIKKGSCPFPNIVVILNGLDAFKESFEELYQNKLGPITRSCTKYGINFILSCTSSAVVNYSIENNFEKRIMLNVSDTQEFITYFPGCNFPSKNPGRGIMVHGDGYVEFQTSLIFDESVEAQSLNYIINKLNEAFIDRAKSIPTVPRKLLVDDLKDQEIKLDYLPIGVNVITAQREFFDFSKKVSALSSNKLDIFNKFIVSLVKLFELCNNNKVIVLNGIEKIDVEFSENVKHYKSSFIKIVNALNSNIQNINTNGTENTYTLVILGYSKIEEYLKKEKANDPSVVTLEELINGSLNNSFKFVVFDTPSKLPNLFNGALSEYTDNQLGIWVGQDYDEQECFEMERQYIEIPLTTDMIVSVDNALPKFIKFPVSK